MQQNIIVLDIETDSDDYIRSNIKRISAIALDGIRLEFFDLAVFDSLVGNEEDQDSPSLKLVWKQFSVFCSQFCVNGEMPALAGFDLHDKLWPIILQSNDQYSIKPFLSDRYYVDLRQVLFLWFGWRSEWPIGESANNIGGLFDWFEYEQEDLLEQCRNDARLILKFLRLHRDLSRKVKFKEAFK